MKKKIVFIGVVALVAMIYLAGCTGTTQNENNANTNSNSNTVPDQTATEVQIPVSDIGTTATFYSYDSSGVTVRYFAVKDKQGTAHVAFDACDVCYEAKKGYKQNGDVMQCLNCGKTFSITSIGTENTAGGCWPSYLHMNIDGNDIVLKIVDLDAKSYMF
ncbi:MAG TPA: Fe-S-containing protein [Candidatus Thermoplasmatota archaeon]|nr:Fe-S-containing protein [Candidatus Thermoplasmatota archaeon]